MLTGKNIYAGGKVYMIFFLFEFMRRYFLLLNVSRDNNEHDFF